MERGIYTLVLSLDHGRNIKVGALSRLDFSQGYYAYTGSARGPGGLMRVKRHREVMSGQKKTRRWHIDYLLPFTSWVDAIITVTDLNLECEIVRQIGNTLRSVPGFGCSDCDCKSHLHFSEDRELIMQAVRSAHRIYQSIE